MKLWPYYTISIHATELTCHRRSTAKAVTWSCSLRMAAAPLTVFEVYSRSNSLPRGVTKVSAVQGVKNWTKLTGFLSVFGDVLKNGGLKNLWKKGETAIEVWVSTMTSEPVLKLLPAQTSADIVLNIVKSYWLLKRVVLHDVMWVASGLAKKTSTKHRMNPLIPEFSPRPWAISCEAEIFTGNVSS